MSVSSIGDSTTQLWQLLQDSRTGQAGSTGTQGTAGGSASSFGLADAAPASAPATGGAVSPTDSASSAAAKVIADLKSFFLDLQSENGLGAAGSTATTGDAQATSDATTKPAAHHGHHHGGGLQDAVAKLLQQYDAQSGATSATPSTTATSV